MRFIYTKAFGIFAACVCLVALLAILQLKGWLGPIRTAVLQVPRPFETVGEKMVLPLKNFFSTVYQLKNIAQENVQLRNRVLQLEQNLVTADQESRENLTLRQELGFVKNTKDVLVACSVLSEHPFGLSQALVLNCGSGEGVTEGQAVISQGYLVGKVTYSSYGSSSALLLTDSNFSTDARISQTNQPAIVKGSFGSGIILDQVPQNSDLQKDWLVVTAGINPRIPKNILIGSVGDILSTPNDLFKRAIVSSPVDLNNLDFVFVVKQ